MELHELYEEVRKRIGRIDFSFLWTGFTPLKFALYTNDSCFFDGNYIEKPEDFVANTSVLYGGEYVAIWNVMETPEDLDEFAAKIVHEMFHGFQNISGETRWPDELAAMLRYQYNAENLTLKAEEARLIQKILTEDTSEYPHLLSVMKQRKRSFPYQFDYEARVAQIEGTALFVEINALSQLNAEKAAKAWQKILEKITDPARYFPIRSVSYDFGAALLECVYLSDAYPYEEFTDKTFSHGIIAGADSAYLQVFTSKAAQLIDEYHKESERIIKAALQKNEIVLEGSYPLVTVNIFDARRYDHWLTSRYFVAYKEKRKVSFLYGNFVVEIDDKFVIHKVYRQ